MCSKHAEAWNKLIIKFSASSWLILINKYIEMHGQQNIKTWLRVMESILYGHKTKLGNLLLVFNSAESVFTCVESVFTCIM